MSINTWENVNPESQLWVILMKMSINTREHLTWEGLNRNLPASSGVRSGMILSPLGLPPFYNYQDTTSIVGLYVSKRFPSSAGPLGPPGCDEKVNVLLFCCSSWKVNVLLFCCRSYSVISLLVICILVILLSVICILVILLSVYNLLICR